MEEYDSQSGNDSSDMEIPPGYFIRGKGYEPSIRKKVSPSHKSAIRNVMISSFGESPERDEQIRQAWQSLRW